MNEQLICEQYMLVKKRIKVTFNNRHVVINKNSVCFRLVELNVSRLSFFGLPFDSLQEMTVFP